MSFVPEVYIDELRRLRSLLATAERDKGELRDKLAEADVERVALAADVFAAQLERDEARTQRDAYRGALEEAREALEAVPEVNLRDMERFGGMDEEDAARAIRAARRVLSGMAQAGVASDLGEHAQGMVAITKGDDKP